LFFLILFFLSGFAALLYQIIWQRMMTFFGGADLYSVTIIVSAFMGGLGFGSLAGGYLADRLKLKQRYLAFAVSETAVALFAVFSKWIYYDLLYLRLGDWAPPRAVMAAIIFAITLWPTFFMGMSLPLLATALTQDKRRPAFWVPLLYGTNTLGAACGSLFAAAVLFRTFDFGTAVQIGALFSFACAVGALVASARIPPVAKDFDDRRDATSAAVHKPAGFSLSTWIGIYALSGFVALSLEIVWFRILGVILKSNSFTFGHLLAVYLLGVGLGAVVSNHRRVRSWSPVSAFFVSQSAIPVIAGVSLLLLVTFVDRLQWLDPLWQYLGQSEPLSLAAVFAPVFRGSLRQASDQLWLFFLVYVVVPITLLGPPTILMGLSFGHLQRAVQTDLDRLGRRVGWLQTANIVGSMIGAMLTGLALLDWFGTSGTLRLLVGCSAVFLLLYSRIHRGLARWMTTGAILVPALITFLIPSSTGLWTRLHGAMAGEVIQSEDSSGLSVLKTKSGSSTTMAHANGLGQSTLPYGGTHTALGALPALIHPNPESVAVIGLGSGDTLFAIGGRPETTTIDSIEIIAPELDGLRLLDERGLYPGLHLLLADTRMRHWFTDGRAFIRRGQKRYDIIEADALRPTSAYAGNLYSVEYFKLLRDRLNPGGVAVNWTPTLRVVSTFVTAFPYVLVFGRVGLGSMSAIPFDRATISARMQNSFTHEYYARAGIDLDAILSPFLTPDPETYGPSFDRTPLVDLNRDLFPKDEFMIRYRN